MSGNQEVTHQSAGKNSHETVESEGGLSMSPPAFQLKAGDDAPSDDNGAGQDSPRQLKAPEFSLSSSPIQKKDNSGSGDVISQMGNAMGADFSNVKVHQDSSKASDVGALAYCQGEELHFAPGQYNPGSQSGKELIGHELTHVVQQREGRVQANTEVNGMPVNNDSSLEKEADTMGRQAANAAPSAAPMQQKEDKSAAKGPLQAKAIQMVNNPISMVISYIQGEMTRNFASAEVKYIKDNLRSAATTWVPGMNVYYMYNAYKKWYDMVRTGGPWDHKSVLRSTYGDWTDDAANSLSYFFDIWSNIHYGYIGRECGFDEWTLLAGAGAAQVMAGTVPDGYWRRRFETLGDADFAAAFDDPKDQAAIRVGFRLWSGFGSGVTTANILSSVRGSSGSLTTRAMSAGTGGGGGATAP